ncbi:hypothetical protein [Streptomyces sp. bgisy082]|uniref:hypothetical protein n=1 Tax=Streptomyces sp. bgisy082 TaxID=3413776 RepID=UPI003D72A89B
MPAERSGVFMYAERWAAWRWEPGESAGRARLPLLLNRRQPLTGFVQEMRLWRDFGVPVGGGGAPVTLERCVPRLAVRGRTDLSVSRWIVLAIPVDGVSEMDRNARTLAEFDGSAEEAESALLEAANTYTHKLWKVNRREIFKCSSRSYFLRIHGRMATYGFLLQLAELVRDTAEPTSKSPA